MTDVVVEIDSLNFHLSGRLEDEKSVMMTGTGLIHTEEYATIRFTFKKVKNQNKITLDINRHTQLWKDHDGDARKILIDEIKRQCNVIIKTQMIETISNLNF